MPFEQPKATTLSEMDRDKAKTLLDTVIEDLQVVRQQMLGKIYLDENDRVSEDLALYRGREIPTIIADIEAIPVIEHMLATSGSLLHEMHAYDAALLHAWATTPGTRGNMVYGTSGAGFLDHIKLLEAMRDAIDDQPSPHFAANRDLSLMATMPDAVQGLMHWNGVFADFVLTHLGAVTGNPGVTDRCRTEMTLATDTFCSEENDALVKKLCAHTATINAQAIQAATSAPSSRSGRGPTG